MARSHLYYDWIPQKLLGWIRTSLSRDSRINQSTEWKQDLACRGFLKTALREASSRNKIKGFGGSMDIAFLINIYLDCKIGLSRQNYFSD